jgi:hypothetical protein
MKRKLTEFQLFDSKTPEEFIDNSLNVNVSSGRKAYVCKQWLLKTGYKVEDIMYARNRHPYWKKIKHIGHEERTRKRLAKYNFENVNKKWDLQEMRRFVELNETLHDFELAQLFRRSIPSIQFIRRKVAMLKKVFPGVYENSTQKAEMLIQYEEQKLRQILKERKSKENDKS